jgi:hypothetical protein
MPLPPQHHGPNDARHSAAVRRTGAWADEAASRRDFAGALEWLAVIEAIGDPLSSAQQASRSAWSQASRAPSP